jgi:phytoene synthase
VVRDRDLVRLHWPAELRPAFDALFGIDDALARVVGTATQPALGAITLAWWREQLEQLDTSAPPAEPTLRAAAAELLPRGIRGRDLAELESGWATLLDEQPDLELVAERGRALFAIGARLLGADSGQLSDAGALFAVADVKRRRMGGWIGAIPPLKARFAPKLRPLTALAALASRDRRRGSDEPEATPGRAWTLLRHRLTGRL